MKDLAFTFLVICLAAWLALTGKREGEPDNFARIIARYERIAVALFIFAAAGWILFALICLDQ